MLPKIRGTGFPHKPFMKRFSMPIGWFLNQNELKVSVAHLMLKESQGGKGQGMRKFFHKVKLGSI